eukprot:jgi/Mesen1/10812/ME000093S10335
MTSMEMSEQEQPVVMGLHDFIRTSSRDSYSWNTPETITLLKRWHEQLLQNNKKDLKTRDMTEILAQLNADIPSTRQLNLSQVKSKIDHMKTTYRQHLLASNRTGEKGSNWVFYDKMHEMFESFDEEDNGLEIVTAGGELDLSNSKKRQRRETPAGVGGAVRHGEAATVGLTEPKDYEAPQIEIIAEEGAALEFAGDLLAIGVFADALPEEANKDRWRDEVLASLDTAAGGLLRELADEDDFKGHQGQTAVMRVTSGKYK